MHHSTEVDAILEQAGQYSRARHSDYYTDAEARQRLNAHGLDDAEITRQLATLKSNTAGTAAVLTSYSLLHSLQHLDTILERPRHGNLSAEAIIALFRCAEVCLYNMTVLSTRMQSNISAGRSMEAVSNARWRAGFHEVVYRLSALIVEVSDDGTPGEMLDIRDSRIHRGYVQANDDLHRMLRSTWPEEEGSIFGKDLDDSQRFVFFSEFVNTSEERVWLSRLSRVRIPGVWSGDGEDRTSFHEKLIGTDELVAMVEALETSFDSDLLPFRAIHQTSEIVASCINPFVCEAVRHVVSHAGDVRVAVRTLVVANRMLSVVDDSIKLLMRALTPRAYKEIRQNLGMVRGTSSVVLRKTLFNSAYPLLVHAFRLRISGLSPAVADDDEAIERCATELLARSPGGPDRELMHQLILFHQHIRAWRDNHQQLPKTHLGVSIDQRRPTVSLSGSASGVDIAHELRKRHASDPIIPLYKALHGTTPPDVHELLTPGGFDQHMANLTASEVHQVYAAVQERFYRRSGVAAQH